MQPGRYTLYAIWDGGAPAATRYALDYKAGLFGPKDTVVKSTADEVELTVTSRAPRSRDQRFLGWSTEPNGQVEYVAGDTITLRKDAPVLALYPVWEKAVQMTTYRLDYKAGFFGPKDTVVKSTADYAVLVVTDKTPRGMGTFLGWSTEKNGAAQYHANDQITLHQDNPTLRLYAVWGK